MRVPPGNGGGPNSGGAPALVGFTWLPFPGTRFDGLMAGHRTWPVPAGREHVEFYLSSRSRPVDRTRFERALHTATVLWFLADDVPHLVARAAPDRAETLVASALGAVERLESC